MGIKEHLESLRKSRSEAADRMNEVGQKAIDEQRSMNDGEQEEFDTIKTELETLDADIKRYSELLDMQAAKAEPVQPEAETAAGQTAQNTTYRVAKNTQKLEPGIEFARYAMCLANAKGDLSTASRIAQKRYPDMERVNNVLKAAVDAGTTTDPQWAGNLTEYNDFVGDFVEFLRPRTILGQFGQGNVPALRRIPFNVHIKGQTAGATAGWVGEGKHKPVTSSKYSDVHLGWAKISGIAVITDDLARFSSPGADALVRDELANAVIERMDTDFVDSAHAGTSGVSPASITNGVSGTAATADPIADIAGMWATADANNLPAASAVYITDAATARGLSIYRDTMGNFLFPNVTMTGGNIGGVPVIVSNYVAANTFILTFASEIWLADDNIVTLDASREASIIMSDDPEQRIADTDPAGTPPTAAPVPVSMYQTNSVAIRAERYINWQKRRDNIVTVVNSTGSWA